MLSIDLVVGALLGVYALLALGWLVLGPYWESRFMTDARRKEVEIRRTQTVGRRAPKTGLVGGITWFGLPIFLVLDGLFLGHGSSILLSYPSLTRLTHTCKVLGLAVTAAGLVIMLSAGYILSKEVYAKAKTERKLITTGLYAYVRHPFYLSWILVSSGVVLVTLNLLALLLLPASLVDMGTEDEERELLEIFGKEYEGYMKRTGRFLPKIGRR